MGLELLNLVLKVGNFVAITPSPAILCRREVKSCHFLHQILIIGLVACDATLSIFLDFRKNYIFVRTTAKVLMHLTLCAFNCWIVLDVSVKREIWVQLMDNLKTTDYLTKFQNERRKGPFYLKFLLIHVAILVISVYVSYYYWGYLSELEYWQQCTTSTLVHYMLYLYSFYIYVILKMIRARYKGFRTYLQQKITRDRHLPLMEMQIITYLMNESVSIFNEIFGKSINLLISYTTFFLINYLDYNISNPFSDGEVFHKITAETLNFLKPFVPTVILILSCDSIVEESETIFLLMYKWCSNCVNSKGREELYRFANFVQKNRPEFNAAGYFTIHKSTILSMLGTVVTFLIVLLQFK
ncbi:7tm 7 domain containing protein [Asbolus verrucosus]|uniref:Gustatory receptor n=1 Tax=Asbolus verrucosus TaxID=1661398 RepID=A0A482VXH1_ASBVE|nr:7tm 7 domain containing protein [Asbolus verrucosus]